MSYRTTDNFRSRDGRSGKALMPTGRGRASDMPYDLDSEIGLDGGRANAYPNDRGAYEEYGDWSGFIDEAPRGERQPLYHEDIADAYHDGQRFGGGRPQYPELSDPRRIDDRYFDRDDPDEPDDLYEEGYPARYAGAALTAPRRDEIYTGRAYPEDPYDDIDDIDGEDELSADGFGAGLPPYDSRYDDSYSFFDDDMGGSFFDDDETDGSDQLNDLDLFSTEADVPRLASHGDRVDNAIQAKPRRDDHKKRVLNTSKFVFILAMTVFVISMGLFGVMLVTRYIGKAEYISLAQSATQGNRVSIDSVTGLATGDGDDSGDGDSEEVTMTMEMLKSYTDDNSDFVGWISFPNTNIHYPLVLHSDNDYYLTHTFRQKYSAYGAVFVDYRCSRDLSDANVVIYGHNIRDGTMFHDLNSMLSQSYFDGHNVFTITLPDGTVNHYQLFAAYRVSASADYRTITIDPGTGRSSYFSGLRASTTVSSEIRSFANDARIVTLSTCPNDSDDNYRIAVHALLVDTTYIEGSTAPGAAAAQ